MDCPSLHRGLGSFGVLALLNVFRRHRIISNQSPLRLRHACLPRTRHEARFAFDTSYAVPIVAVAVAIADLARSFFVRQDLCSPDLGVDPVSPLPLPPKLSLSGQILLESLVQELQHLIRTLIVRRQPCCRPRFESLVQKLQHLIRTLIVRRQQCCRLLFFGPYVPVHPCLLHFSGRTLHVGGDRGW